MRENESAFPILLAYVSMAVCCQLFLRIRCISALIALSSTLSKEDEATYNEIMDTEKYQQVAAALKQTTLPAGIEIRAWNEDDFPAIQQLSSAEGWPSPTMRPTDSLQAWQHSWPTLVAIEGSGIVGFVRGLTDGAISMFIAEMAVDTRHRGRGIGRALLEVCHLLYPTTRLDLLSVDEARDFYKACGFRVIHDGMRKSYR